MEKLIKTLKVIQARHKAITETFKMGKDRKTAAGIDSAKLVELATERQDLINESLELMKVWLPKFQKANGTFFINHSGGKDSQAMYIDLTKFVPQPQRVIVHCDLGKVEWSGCKEHILNTIDKGDDFKVVVAGKDLIELIWLRFKNLVDKGKTGHGTGTSPLPSASTRFCTSQLKIAPSGTLVRNHRRVKKEGNMLIVDCSGIRADESDNRGKSLPFTFDEKNSLAGRTWFSVNPIHDWSEPQVWACIKAEGQVGHFKYAEGMSRLSCSFCFLANKSDLVHAATNRPGLYSEYVNIEKVTGFTFFTKKIKGKMVRVPLEEKTGIKAQPFND